MRTEAYDEYESGNYTREHAKDVPDLYTLYPHITTVSRRKDVFTMRTNKQDMVLFIAELESDLLSLQELNATNPMIDKRISAGV